MSKLPILIQGMTLPEYSVKMSTRMPGSRSCARLPGQEAEDVKDIMQGQVWEAVVK
jgi:hypothetical protein